ncbi:hypothetical protein [Aeromonas hydrophila]|uniref:hypothetical protein n=1 Tax=Aeromonas hydrophila TaxID=644 RepID=UPI00216850C1|nr:hypothetical protein [Aeromonas hydrophila]MCS3793772.1 hypothetical protein [Aeromonas hydrophila]
MHPNDFIAKHIKETLEKEQFHPHAISLGVTEATRHFDRTPSFAKGKVFDECLKAAREVARVAKKAVSAKKTKP